MKATIDLVTGAVEQGEKVIVFSCFEEPVQQLVEAFRGSAILMTGETPAEKRQAMVDRFQQDDRIRVFVANIIAGGVGHNLTAATQVVFNDLDWVPANHWQAEDRAYRIGQTRTVNVTYMVAADTIDDFVQMVLEKKARLVSAIVDGTAMAQDVSGDVLDELQRALREFSSDVADPRQATDGEQLIEQLLQQARLNLDGGPSRDAGAVRTPEETRRAPASARNARQGAVRSVGRMLPVRQCLAPRRRVPDHRRWRRRRLQLSRIRIPRAVPPCEGCESRHGRRQAHAGRLPSRVMGGTPRPRAIHEEADASACVDYFTDSDETVSRKPLGSTTSNTRVFHSLSNGSDLSVIPALLARAATSSTFCVVDNNNRRPTPFCRSRPFFQSS